MQGGWVWFLVGELRSHMPCNVAKKKKKRKFKNKDTFKKTRKMIKIIFWSRMFQGEAQSFAIVDVGVNGETGAAAIA